MKLVLELNEMPKKDDVLVFNGDKFNCVNKNAFLSDINHRMKEIETKFGIMANSVDKKLNEYHDILQLLTKEGE